MATFNAGSVVAKIKADITGFKQGLSTATKSVKNLKKEAGKQASQIGKPFAKAGSDIKNVFSGARAEINRFGNALGGAALVFGFKSLTQAASDAAEAANKTQLAFGGAAQKINTAAETSAKSFGISKREFQDLTGTLGIMMTNMGVTQEAAADMSIEMTQAAADMGSAFNRDPIQVMEDMRSALAGSTETLQKYGLRLNETAIQEKARELGLITGKQKVDDYGRALAINAFIMEKSASVAGDFANTSDQAANKQRIVAAQVEDLKAKIGEGLLPIYLKLLQVMQFVIEWINNEFLPQWESFTIVFANFIELMKLRFTTFRDTVVNTWNNMIISMRLVWLGFTNAIKAIIDGAFKFISGVFTAFWNTLSSITSAGWNLIHTAWTTALDGIFTVANGVLDRIRNIFKQAINWIINQINALIGRVNGVAKSLTFGKFDGLGTIPTLAEGGIVTGPTLAMIGEGGESEAVIPLSQLGNFGGGGTVININDSLVADEESAVELMERAFNAMSLKTEL